MKFNIDVTKIIDEYKSGDSCQTIANKYGVCDQTIRHVLIKAGFPRRARGAHMSTDRNPTKGKGHTEAAKEKIREANRKQFSTQEARDNHASLQRLVMIEGRHKKKITKPELAVQNILDELNIKYKFQAGIRNDKGQYIAIVDFLVGQIVVEVQGDFWHCNPKIYLNGPKYSAQYHTLDNDKRKFESLSSMGYKFLYLWENDIKNQLELVRSLIKSEFLK